MHNISLREATINDLAILLHFEQEIVNAERPFDNTLKDGEPQYYNFPQLIASIKAKVMLAEVDDEIVGSGFVEIRKAEDYLKHAEYAYMGLMYVKENFRGMGINRQMVQELKAWAIGQNIHEIRLMVYDDNSNAKNAYLKAGFKPHVLEMRMEILNFLK